MWYPGSGWRCQRDVGSCPQGGPVPTPAPRVGGGFPQLLHLVKSPQCATTQLRFGMHGGGAPASLSIPTVPRLWEAGCLRGGSDPLLPQPHPVCPHHPQGSFLTSLSRVGREQGERSRVAGPPGAPHALLGRAPRGTALGTREAVVRARLAAGAPEPALDPPTQHTFRWGLAHLRVLAGWGLRATIVLCGERKKNH